MFDVFPYEINEALSKYIYMFCTLQVISELTYKLIWNTKCGAMFKNKGKSSYSTLLVKYVSVYSAGGRTDFNQHSLS